MEKVKKETTKKKTNAKDEKVLAKKEITKSTKSKKKETKKVDKKEDLVKEVKKEKVKKKEAKKNKKEKKLGFFKKICNFFKSIKTEMSKVTWPNKKNMIKYSIATIVFIIFFALFFYGIIVVFGLLKDLIVII